MKQSVAQGKYNYQLAQHDSGLTETWTLQRSANGLLEHQAQVNGRVGLVRLKQNTQLRMTAEYRPQYLEMTQQLNENEAQTTLHFTDDLITQTITVAGETHEAVLEVPINYALFLPPVSLQGFILRQYDQVAGGRQTLNLVSLRMQPEDNLPLSVTIRPVDYEYCNDEEIETLAGQFACRHFRRYEQHMEQDLWIDKDDVVIQWSVPYSPIMKWDYLLVQYQRG